jgi:hypothetical protein
MSTLKTSISILALITGLTIGFAPQASFAQNAGAVDGVQKIVDKTNDTTSKLDKLKDDEAKRQANAAKNNPQPPATTNKPATGGAGGGSGTGGTSGFLPTPAPAPAAPSWWDKCVDGACTAAKWIIAPGAMLWDKLDPLDSKVDETQAQKDHNAAVHKLIEDKKKAAAAEAQNQPKTTEAPKTETKKAEPAPAKAPETKAVETPKTKAVELKSVETPKTKTAETRITPVVIPNKAAALLPASRTAPTVARTPAVTPVATPVRPVSTAAVVTTTVGPVRIVTGPPVMTPRVPTPTITIPGRR